MGRFFDWLAKPMKDEDITAWYLANNITPELSELFRDFCLSFLELLNDTYLGDDNGSFETKVGMTDEQKRSHFKWCWNKTIDNFKKEDIQFIFNDMDSEFLENFFYDIFYSQKEQKMKDDIKKFFVQIFDEHHKKTKSDIEIFTDIYKVLERALKN